MPESSTLSPTEPLIMPAPLNATRVSATRVNATLVLAAGSRAGLEAFLMPGYYMIGRHAECQIRPKSKSVSRRHCLVHHQANGVRVFDLGSTSGTTINDKKIAPKCWVDLNDGDLLRLGKIGFRLALDQAQNLKDAEPESPELRTNDSRDSASKNAESIVTGEAWDTFDIAGFLGSADEADRAERYAKIRSEHKKASDSDVFDEETLDCNGSSSGFITNESTEERSDSPPTLIPPNNSLSKKTEAIEHRSARSVKMKPNDSRLKSGFSGLASKIASEGEDAEKRKLVLAAILAIGVLGFAAHKAYQFTSGPQVRVLEEIDS